MTTQVIIGCPGAGKTTTLLGIVEEELANGTPPDRIAFLSFTRRATIEATERACKKFNLSRKAFPYFRTIHSLCFQQLGLRKDDVFESKKLQEFADYAKVRITGKWSEDGTLSGFELGDRIIFIENLARVREVPLEQAYNADNDGVPREMFDRVTKALVKFKQERGLLDFTDMLNEFVEQHLQLDIDVLIIDESQDNSKKNWRVIEQIARGCRRVIFAADEDQCIYSWSGAEANYLLSTPGEVRMLDESHRVPPTIQRLAQSIIERVKSRRQKHWHAQTTRGEGTIAYAQRFHEVDCTTGNDILVLARNTYVLTSQVVPELRRQGVVYEMYGHPSVSPSLLKAITAYERVRAGGEASVEEARSFYALMSVGKGVTRGFKTLPNMQDDERVTLIDLQKNGGLLTNDIWHAALDKIPETEAEYIIRCRKRGERLNAAPRVRVSTIHGAKGAESDHVVLMKEMVRRTYNEMEKNPDDEARVQYVACTRAKEKLTIVESQTALACPWL